MRVPSLRQKDSLEKGVATHSSTLAWRIPWTEETGGLLPMESQRARRAHLPDTRRRSRATPACSSA